MSGLRQGAVLIVRQRLLYLLVGIHHKGSVLGYGLAQGLARQHQKARLFTRAVGHHQIPLGAQSQ